MIKGFFNFPWFVWTGLALIVAVFYYFVWPQKAVTDSTGFRFLVIRYAHTLTWLLLAINFFLRGLSLSFNGAANLVAATGALVYFLFGYDICGEINIMFIQENRTKLKLKAGQPAYGVLSTSDDPQLAELFGLAGFDYYMLDAEHGLMDVTQVDRKSVV